MDPDTAATDAREPFWRVMAVYDPDGEGGDFSYTVGLSARERPELWLSARPALGEDPGLDWWLSLDDTGRILNALSWDWLTGRLQIGDERVESFDCGLVEVRFRLDPPDDPERLEAFGVPAGAEVVPVRWSLHRAVPAGDASMSESARLGAELVWSGAREPFTDVPAPSGWSLPDEPSWAAEQRFGPRTPLVLARAAWLWSADGGVAVDLVSTALEANAAQPIRWPMATLVSAARAAGRTEAHELAQEAAEDLVDALMPDWLPRLREALDLVSDAEDEHVRQLLVDVAQLALGAEVVADVLPEEARLAALGPLLCGLRPPTGTTDDGWLAATEVRALVDRLLGDLDAADLVALTRAHEGEESEEYWAVVAWLHGMLTTTASRWQPLTDLFDDRVLEGVDAYLDDDELLAIAEVGGLVAACLTHRMLLDAEQVAALARPYREVLPGLLDLLNAPV